MLDEPAAEDFQSHRTFHEAVLGLEDHAHAAGAQDFQDAVAWVVLQLHGHGQPGRAVGRGAPLQRAAWLAARRIAP